MAWLDLSKQPMVLSVPDTQDLSRRALKICGLATVYALAPSSAGAQDASVLVVFGAPPFLLAPFLAAVIRGAWLRGASGPAPPSRRLLGLGLLEFLLWLVVAWLAALLVFQEEWLAGLLLGGILAAIVALNRLLVARRGSWLFSVAIASVFPAAWLLLQLLSYGLLLWYGRLSA